MAAPKTKPTKRQQDQTRAAIQTTKLVKRLESYALGKTEADVGSGEEVPIELDSGRLKAIEILLRKSLPDLQAVTISGDDENPVTITMQSPSEAIKAMLDAKSS